MLLTATEPLRAAAPRVVRERLFAGAVALVLDEVVGTDAELVASDLRFAPRRVVTPAPFVAEEDEAEACCFCAAASSRFASSWCA